MHECFDTYFRDFGQTKDFSSGNGSNSFMHGIKQQKMMFILWRQTSKRQLFPNFFCKRQKENKNLTY